MNDSEQYHPTFFRSEYDYYRRLERKQSRMAIIGIGLIVVGVVGLYLVLR